MKVSDILASSGETRFSLEVFPPKVIRSPGAPNIYQLFSNIFQTVEHLRKYDPAFVSVTYNPGPGRDTTPRATTCWRTTSRRNSSC